MAASNIINNPSFISGTTAGHTWTANTTISSNLISSGTVVFEKPPPKYWWKYTHYECPLCGNVDTVRERVNTKDQPKPKEPEDRHTDVVIACGFHFT